MDTRSQTTQDYVVGISIVLLTVMGTFAFVPSTFVSAQDPVEKQERVQANELADTIVEQYSAGDRSYTLVYRRVTTELTGQTVPQQLRGAAGIQRNRVNVTITDGEDSSNIVTKAGDRINNDRPKATTVRHIRFENESRCGQSGVCQLTVRVW